MNKRRAAAASIKRPAAILQRPATQPRLELKNDLWGELVPALKVHIFGFICPPVLQEVYMSSYEDRVRQDDLPFEYSNIPAVMRGCLAGHYFFCTTELPLYNAREGICQSTGISQRAVDAAGWEDCSLVLLRESRGRLQMTLCERPHVESWNPHLEDDFHSSESWFDMGKAVSSSCRFVSRGMAFSKEFALAFSQVVQSRYRLKRVVTILPEKIWFGPAPVCCFTFTAKGSAPSRLRLLLRRGARRRRVSPRW